MSRIGPRVRLLLAGALLILSLDPEAPLACLIDQEEHIPLDYLSFMPPSAGSEFLDPVFGTRIKRLTDAVSTPDAAGTGPLTTIINEYSTMSPFNRVNSLLLLIHQSYFALYDGEGHYLRDLPFEINSGSEPRWSRTRPNVLYYVSGNQLKRYDVGTDTLSVMRTFPEYSTVNGKGESDIAWDGNHFVLAGDGRYIFVYELSSGRKGRVLDTGGLGPFNQIYLTPQNNVLVGWETPGTGRYLGLELYDRNMRFLRQVSRAIGHMDVTRDVGGAEVVVMTNAGDPDPVCPEGVVKIRLSNAKQTCLLALDPILALHVSTPSRGGWCVVSTYAPSDPDPATGWPVYTNEILQMKIDGSEVRRLAHHRSRPFNAYNYQPRASVSRDGTRIVYSSNEGLQALLGYPPEYSDAYLLWTPSVGPDAKGSACSLTGQARREGGAAMQRAAADFGYPEPGWWGARR